MGGDDLLITVFGTGPVWFSNVGVSDQDTGRLLTITGETGHLTLTEFQRGPNGIVNLGNLGFASTAQALASLVPDAQGGTLLALHGGGAFFVGPAWPRWLVT
jgi:hypothetical protein